MIGSFFLNFYILHSFPFSIFTYFTFFFIQFGFRLNFSSNNTLISIVKNIQTQLDDGKYSASVFNDLKKAFDTVDHNMKLDYYGAKGIENDWFWSYLKNRKQFFSIGNHNSSTQVIQTGFPQGSDPGSLLFPLYIDDLNKYIKDLRAYYFADDTNIYFLMNHLNYK